MVRDSLDKGDSVEKVRESLLNRGMSVSYVENVLTDALKQQNTQDTRTSIGTPERSLHGHGVWWVGLTVILVVSVIALLVFTHKLNFDFLKKVGTSQTISQQDIQANQKIVQQQKQEETVRNLERASGTLKDLGSTF